VPRFDSVCEESVDELMALPSADLFKETLEESNARDAFETVDLAGQAGDKFFQGGDGTSQLPSVTSKVDIECTLCCEEEDACPLVFCSKSHAFCPKCVLALVRTGDSCKLQSGGIVCPWDENKKLTTRPSSPPLPTAFESAVEDNFEVLMGWYGQHRPQYDDSHIIPDNVVTAFLNGTQEEALAYQRVNLRQAFSSDYDSVMECPKCSSTCLMATPAAGSSKVASCPYCHHVFCLDCRDVYPISDLKNHRCLPK